VITLAPQRQEDCVILKAWRLVFGDRKSDFVFDACELRMMLFQEEGGGLLYRSERPKY
jgi:hypothetical protein